MLIQLDIKQSFIRSNKIQIQLQHLQHLQLYQLRNMELNRRSIGAQDHSYERTQDLTQQERTRQIGESPQGIINGVRSTANPFLGSAQRNRSGRSSGQNAKVSKLGSPGKSGSNPSSLLKATQSSKQLNVQDSMPSVSEPHANERQTATETEEYQKLLQQTGLQVHPKQQAQLFKDKKVQKFLKQQSNNNQQLDAQTADILARAGNTQASIAQTANQYGREEAVGSKEPREEAEEHDRSPIQEKFHNEFQHIIESNLKEQIAKEIAYQIQQNIQITLKTPKESDQQSATDQSSSNNPTPAQKTKKKITNSQKKSLNFIRKGTFSSQQKTQFSKQEATHGYKGKIGANPADPLDVNNQLEKKARKKSTQPYSNQTSTKKSNIRFTEDEDDDGVDYPVQQPPSGSRRGAAKSKSSQASNNFRKQESNKSPSGRSLLAGRNEAYNGQATLKPYKNQQLENKSQSKKKVQSASNSARGQQRDEDGPQPSDQQAHSPNDAERVSHQMNDSARQLQEKMKQISVYDLYQITNQNGSIPIDTFIKQQLLQSQQILPASKERNERSPRPGVAPQVKKVASGTSSQKSLSNVNIHIGSVIQRAGQIEEQKGGSALLRHRGQQPSTIPETVDENNSLVGTPVREGSIQINFPEDSPLKEESKINLLQDSRISKKLQKEPNSRNDETVVVTKANKAKTADVLKKSYENFKTKLNNSGLSKDAEQPKSLIERTPKSQRKEKAVNSKSNKYLINLNKKYVSQSPNKLGNHSFLDEKADNRRSLSPLLYHGRAALGPANAAPNRQSTSNFTSKRTSLNALDDEETNQFKLIEQSFQEPIRTSLQLFNQNQRQSEQSKERKSSFEPGTLAKNRNSMVNLSLQKHQTYQELKEQNLFFVRKQTTPKVQIIKGLQEKYSSKMNWNNTIEEEQHELTRSISEGKHEKLQKAVENQMRDQKVRSSQPRNAAGLSKGNTTERTFVMKAQINLLLEGEAQAQMSDEGLDGKKINSGRRDRQARSNSRQVLEASRPLSEQSMGRLSQNTAQGALRRTRKDRSNNGKRVLSPPSDYQEAVPKSDNANLSQSAAQPGSTLFQNLINSRLDANGTPGAGRATPTPHLQISELSSNLHFGEAVADYKVEPTQPKPYIQPFQKLKSGKTASKSQNRIQPNPYQYHPGSDKKQTEALKAKGSGRSLNVTKRSGKGTKKSANKSYKKSDSRRNSTDLGDMMLGEPQMPLGKSFQIIQGNEDENPFAKGLSYQINQSMGQSGLRYGVAKTQAEQLSHQKVQSKRKELKKSNQKSSNQRTSSRQGPESQDDQQQQFQQVAAPEEGMVDIPPSIFDKSMGVLGTNPVIPQINKNTQKNRDPVPSRGYMDMENQIKNYRKQLNQQLSQINFVNHRELDQIKKPQKYMFFAAYLFKVLFDLITQIHNLNLQFQNKRNKKYKDMIANDFNQDLDITKQSDSGAPDEEDDVEGPLLKKVHQKYFMHAEQDLKAFIHFLPLEQNSKPAISQVDKVILNEWQTKLKPFLSQNTQQFQNAVSELSKRLKRLIENSEDSQTDLQQIKDFSLRIIEFLDVYANLYNACAKAGKIFGRIMEIVKNACCYAYKKCEKTLLKSNSASASHVRTQEDEDFDRDGDENPLEQIEQDNRNKSAIDIVANDPIEIGQEQPQYAVNMFQDQGTLDIQRRMTVDDKKLKKKDSSSSAFKQASQLASASKRHSEISNVPKKGSSFLTQLIEQQSQKQKVFDYGASSQLAQPSLHDDPLNFKIQLQPVDIDSELSQFDNESNKQSEKSNKRIETEAKQEQVAPASSGQPEPTSSPQSQMQSYRLENSLKQGYEFSKFAVYSSAQSDPSGPQTPAAVASQKPIELEQDKIEYEIEQPHSEAGLADDDSNGLRQSGIFGVNKALYDDQVTTNSSAAKGFISVAATVDAASEQTKSVQQSIAVEKQEEGQTVDLDQIKIQVDNKDDQEEKKASSTPQEYFSFDHEEPPNPEPRSPEPTTPTKQQKPLLMVSVDVSYDSPKPSHPSSQQASKEEASTEQEQTAPVGNTQKVQDIINELKAQMLLDSQLKPTGNLLLSHTKKKSVNPYLSSSANVSQQASAPNSKESSPKKPEAGQKKLLQKFTPEYGLYNPEYGILLYQNDPDFDNEIDHFRIIPMKIFNRTSQTQPSSASKLARRSPGGSPLVGGANSRGSRGSMNKSRRTAESNNGSATKAIVRQRLGTGPGGSGLRTSTLLGRPIVEPPQILEKTNEDSLNESISINLGTSPFSPFQPPEQKESRKPLSSEELMQKFHAKIGDTANPYNQASRSKSRGESNERARGALDRSIAEKRLQFVNQNGTEAK